MNDAPREDTVYDAVIVGGGPGGAACAMTLARAGRSVLLLERTVFPRFHIGESLLTYTVDVLARLGVLDRVLASGFVVKRGVELSGPEGNSYRIGFDEIGEGYRDWTLQVERAEFDQILLDAAAAEGAKVVEGARVTAPVLSGDRVSGVRYTLDDGSSSTVRAHYVVDASGRTGVISRALGLRRNDESIRMVAAFKHYAGTHELHNPGAKGDIQLGNHPDGWVWGIPIRKDVISIGTVVPVDVMRQGRAEEVFEEHLSRIPRIHARTRGARVVRELTGETDYSHYSERLAGPGYYIVGDAGCFTDPIFSAGVFLALVTGMESAACVNASLDGAGPGREREIATSYEDFCKTGFDTYHRLIRAFYDNGYSVYRYLTGAIDDPTQLGGILRLLNGDFWNEHDPVSRKLREVPQWGMFESFTPDYNCPVHGDR
ncbi:NAD(P)/FAD-dependent oxidoreductase [Nocardiopsis alborubida]|uniref:NAD(P)/FAD-dependent oxidoreductase n=2 Tax=Nocardiopsis TaxID=2013 RepID=A0A7X6RNU8_9ACTN|nr:NAD(P)/FAD-dependent oxidoreductase [Nocardiopsis alborubida]NKY97165.1 NAD(P)/FAD-dependent oxidoreductase [Nocardiopsis alborubida]QOP59283.1 halogenase [Nocardiopsis sp.]